MASAQAPTSEEYVSLVVSSLPSFFDEAALVALFTDESGNSALRHVFWGRAAPCGLFALVAAAKTKHVESLLPPSSTQEPKPDSPQKVMVSSGVPIEINRCPIDLVSVVAAGGDNRSNDVKRKTNRNNSEGGAPRKKPRTAENVPCKYCGSTEHLTRQHKAPLAGTQATVEANIEEAPPVDRPSPLALPLAERGGRDACKFCGSTEHLSRQHRAFAASNKQESVTQPEEERKTASRKAVPSPLILPAPAAAVYVGTTAVQKDACKFCGSTEHLTRQHKSASAQPVVQEAQPAPLPSTASASAQHKDACKFCGSTEHLTRQHKSAAAQSAVQEAQPAPLPSTASAQQDGCKVCGSTEHLTRQHKSASSQPVVQEAQPATLPSTASASAQHKDACKFCGSTEHLTRQHKSAANPLSQQPSQQPPANTQPKPAAASMRSEDDDGADVPRAVTAAVVAISKGACRKCGSTEHLTRHCKLLVTPLPPKRMGSTAT